jgi:hypothetical protein
MINNITNLEFDPFYEATWSSKTARTFGQGRVVTSVAIMFTPNGKLTGREQPPAPSALGTD